MPSPGDLVEKILPSKSALEGVLRGGGATRQGGEPLGQAITAHHVVRYGDVPRLAGGKTELAIAPSADFHLIGKWPPVPNL